MEPKLILRKDYILKNKTIVPYKVVDTEIIRLFREASADGNHLGYKKITKLLLEWSMAKYKATFDLSLDALRRRVGALLKRYKRYGDTLPTDSLKTGLSMTVDPPIAEEDIKLPEGESDYIKPLELDFSKRILCLYDVHVPFHKKTEVETALSYGLANKADTIFIGGDFMDCHAISRFERDPDRRSFKQEREMTMMSLATIRKLFPKARIYYQLGNHELRYSKFMNMKAPELYGISDFEFSAVMRLANFGIECMQEYQLAIAGELTFLHGHEIFGSGGSVNVARIKALKAKTNIIFGHHHKTQNNMETSLHNKITGSWSVGCLADLHPKYNPYANGWNHGFAFVVINSDGTFQVENKSIYQNSIY